MRCWVIILPLLGWQAQGGSGGRVPPLLLLRGEACGGSCGGVPPLLLLRWQARGVSVERVQSGQGPVAPMVVRPRLTLCRVQRLARAGRGEQQGKLSVGGGGGRSGCSADCSAADDEDVRPVLNPQCVLAADADAAAVAVRRLQLQLLPQGLDYSLGRTQALLHLSTESCGFRSGCKGWVSPGHGLECG